MQGGLLERSAVVQRFLWHILFFLWPIPTAIPFVFVTGDDGLLTAARRGGWEGGQFISRCLEQDARGKMGEMVANEENWGETGETGKHQVLCAKLQLCQRSIKNIFVVHIGGRPCVC